CARRLVPREVFHMGRVLVSVPASRRFHGRRSMKIWRHMRELWPRYTLAPALPFWAWAAFWTARGQMRWDHLAMAVLVTVLAYSNATTKRLFVGLLPIGLVALFYDAMRFVKNVGLSESTVHVCDLRAAELRWFGVTAGGARMTLHDWLQA